MTTTLVVVYSKIRQVFEGHNLGATERGKKRVWSVLQSALLPVSSLPLQFQVKGIFSLHDVKKEIRPSR